jgi:hypothetical protein
MLIFKENNKPVLREKKRVKIVRVAVQGGGDKFMKVTINGRLFGSMSGDYFNIAQLIKAVSPETAVEVTREKNGVEKHDSSF